MNALTREWLEKAEADLGTATRELKTPGVPNPDAVCFHAQQAVEKSLKAVLQDSGLAFPKSHDLVELLELMSPPHPELGSLRDKLDALTVYAVAYRYPGDAASVEDARRAIVVAEKALEIVRRFLEPPQHDAPAEDPEDQSTTD